MNPLDALPADAPDPAALLVARALTALAVPAPLWRDLLPDAAPLPALDAALGAALGAAPDPFEALEALYAAARFRAARSDRRAVGAFYTPAPLAAWLVATAADGLAAESPRVVDLAMGCGVFLAAAARALAHRRPALLGADIDPAAVAIARARVRAALPHQPEAWRGLALADGLELPLDGGVDLVVGNPPFGSAISADTARDDATRLRHRALFPDVATGAYDLANLFTARAARLLRPRGRYALILPRSALSLASAAPLRALLAEIAPPTHLWAPADHRIFPGADVLIAALIGQQGLPADRPVATATADAPADGQPPRWRLAPPTLGRPWSALLLHERHLLDHLDARTVPLSTHFMVFGGCATDAAYRLLPHLVDDPDASGLKLITTGLIDRACHRWGQARCRYLKRDLRHPRWPAPDDPATPAEVARAEGRQRRPKVLVAGLSRVLEAVADPTGELGGAVSTWVVTADALDACPGALRLLEATLNTPLLALAYAAWFAGKSLGGGNTTVGRRELLTLPLPADFFALAAAAPAPLDDPFDLDPDDPDHRRALAAHALHHHADAPDPRADALTAAALSRLYGLDRDEHGELLAWFLRKSGIRLEHPWLSPGP